MSFLYQYLEFLFTLYSYSPACGNAVAKFNLDVFQHYKAPSVSFPLASANSKFFVTVACAGAAGGKDACLFKVII